MEAQLFGCGKCFIVFDSAISSDGKYYYSLLMQDFCWHRNGDKWSGSAYYTKRPKLGSMYLNTKHQVAIYFYPQDTYDVFKASTESPK